MSTVAPQQEESYREAAGTAREQAPEVELAKALSGNLDEPWLHAFIRNIKETFNPPKVEEIVVTSQPVAVKDIWGAYGGNESKSGLMSVAIHVGVVALLLFVGTSPAIQKKVRETMTLVAPDLAPYKPEPKTRAGGGGGGDRTPVPPAKGKLPKQAPKQFTPPMQVVNNPKPKMIMEPTVIAQDMPNINMPILGDPSGKIGPLSNGPGFGSGIGSGTGGGVGSGSGAGVGPGSGGNSGGGAYRVGGGVSAPVPIFRPEPEYSEEARKAKFQGVVLVSLVVDEKGNPQNIRVMRPLGLGLDEKAIEAVQKWRFKPGLKEGRPVPVTALIEVKFSLL